jgi:hypothetical protein
MTLAGASATITGNNVRSEVNKTTGRRRSVSTFAYQSPSNVVEA